MIEPRTVFISHSWAQGDLAQEVADRLTALGATPIVDKAELAAGDDVVDQLKQLLQQADELLMLCSAEALASPWVMLEIGAVWALNLLIAPVIVDDTAINDLPQVLNRLRVLRWDQIEDYYAELMGRMGLVDGTIADAAAAGPFPAVGRHVVVDGPGAEWSDARDDIGWKDGMERHRGKHATITIVDEDDHSVLLDVDKGDYWWAVEWLSPAGS